MKKKKHLALLVAAIGFGLILSGCAEDNQSTKTEAAIVTANNAWIATKNTTRINTSDPYQLAVSSSQTLWTSAEGSNKPGGVILVSPEDWRIAAASADLIHFPNNGPVLFAERNNIPDVTMNELKRLKPSGAKENDGVQVIFVGKFDDSVRNQVEELGYKTDSIAAGNPYDYAKQIDDYYAKASGSYPSSVIIGSADAPDFTLPAVNWIAHSPEPLLYVTENEIPQETIDALKNRNGKANIYIVGPESVISSAVEEQLQAFGTVKRISANDPYSNSIEFAKYKDKDTGFGWGITTPGHNVSMVNKEQTTLAIAAAPFSHLGKHAPMLWTDKDSMPDTVMEYLMSIQPKYNESPAEGPYNHAWIIGGEDVISYAGQVEIDDMLEITSASGGEGHAGH